MGPVTSASWDWGKWKVLWERSGEDEELGKFGIGLDGEEEERNLGSERGWEERE